jgi:hypothetical protein
MAYGGNAVIYVGDQLKWNFWVKRLVDNFENTLCEQDLEIVIRSSIPLKLNKNENAYQGIQDMHATVC